MGEEKTPQEQITALREAFCPPEKTPEYNKDLCDKYPFLIWYGDPLYRGYSEDHDIDYTYTWEDELPPGWRKAFCPKMWDELKAILEKANYVNEFRFVQIKEKWGTLRLYYNSVPHQISDEIVAWEQKYDRMSEETCIDCGAPATRMTLGWINFVCDKCSERRHEEFHIRLDDEESWVSIPIKDLNQYYKDRKAYFESHKDDRKY